MISKKISSWLDKFHDLSWFALLLIGLVACEKNNEASANKALIAVTNTSPNAQPFNVLLGGINLTSSGKLGYGITTGSQGNPYLQGVAGVSNFQALPDSGGPYVNGNVNLLVNKNYSVFVFDTVQSGQLKSLLLQDNLTAPPVSNSGIRFLNFSYDTVGLVPIIGTDTLGIYSLPYAGTIQNPSSASGFQNFLSGPYQFLIIIGTYIVGIDSLNLSSGKNYTLYSQGDINSLTTPLTLQLIQHN
jgi:hypothetical protein